MNVFNSGTNRAVLARLAFIGSALGGLACSSPEAGETSVTPNEDVATAVRSLQAQAVLADAARQSKDTTSPGADRNRNGDGNPQAHKRKIIALTWLNRRPSACRRRQRPRP